MLLAMLGLGVLAGCAQPTTYAPANERSAYGYADERLDTKTWQVSFSGNRTTPRDQVERLLLYRAAKLAEEQGAPHFVLIDKSIERETRYYGSVFPLHGGLYTHHYWHRHRHLPYSIRAPFTGVGNASLRPIHRYTGHATVRLFEGPPPEGLGAAFETSDVLQTLAPAVGATPAPN